MTEWDAAAYARISGLQAAMAAAVLALLQFKGDEQVLDVGCGNGTITSQIATRVPRGSVIGVDPSREMIAYATGHFGASAFPNLRFDLCDARTLPFQDAFDRVVSFNALHWVPDQDAALRSIRRAMKATGRAKLRLVVDGERNGLRVVERRVHDKAWDFGTPAAFHAFCAVGCVAWTERLPEAMRDAFIDDALDRYPRAIGARPSEDSVFRFYQMDVTLERDTTRAP